MKIPVIGRKASGAPPEGGGVVMVACEIPAHYAERIRTMTLIPRELVFEQTSGELVTGRPVHLPVRELGAMDILVMAQRAIHTGQIVPAIAFQIPDAPVPKSDTH